MENCKPVPTPMEAGALNFMVPNTEEATKAEINEYQSKMGSVTYLATQTRADVAFTCSVLSRFLANPSKDHMRAVDRLLSYLLGLIYLAVVFGGAAIKQDDDEGSDFALLRF